MVVPVRTTEQRTTALTAPAATHAQLPAVKAGEIPAAQVLARTGPLTTRTRVTAGDEALPGVGAVRAEQLITDLEVNPGRRVGGLATTQRTALLSAAKTTPRTRDQHHITPRTA